MSKTLRLVTREESVSADAILLVPPLGPGRDIEEHNNLLTALRGYTYNVKSFGAVGNGTTDDTAAIQAVATALASTGGSVYFPAGKYLVTSTITWAMDNTAAFSGLNIFGDGGSSQIYCTSTDSTDCFYFVRAAAGDQHTLHIHDLSFIGAGASSATGNAITLRRCIFPSKINNVFIRNFGGGAGILLYSCWKTHIDAVDIYYGKYGVEITNDVTGNDICSYTGLSGSWGSSINITIQSCELNGHSVGAIYVPNIDNLPTITHLTVDNCIIEGNGGGGIVAYGAYHNEFRNIYFESNNTTTPKADLYLQKCVGGTITNCTAHYGALPYPAITMDSDCNGFFMHGNDWGSATVDLSSARVITSMEMPTTSTGWSNYLHSNARADFAAGDATPSVAQTSFGYRFFHTANTGATTITDFDDGYEGQDICVYVEDAFTTFDFSGTNLRGNGGVDYAAANGDVIRAVLHNTDKWFCTIIKPFGGTANGAIVAGKCTAVEAGDSALHRTTLTLTLTGANDLDLANDDHGTGIKIYDFPVGHINILGAVMNGIVNVNNAFEANPNDLFYLACGSAVGADDADLTSTEADLIPKTTIDTTGNTLLVNLDWHNALAASAQFDGTSSALGVYVNAAVAGTSLTKALTIAITGTLTITWINLGTY